MPCITPLLPNCNIFLTLVTFAFIIPTLVMNSSYYCPVHQLKLYIAINGYNLGFGMVDKVNCC